MQKTNRKKSAIGASKKLEDKLAKKQLVEMSKDEAVATILPLADDTTPYARRDLSPQLVKTIKPWSSQGNNITRFKFNYSAASLTQLGVESDYSLTFTLSACASVTQLSALYDQYRIKAAAVTFTPQINGSSGLAVSANPFPKLYTVIDYDDATPITIAAMQQYDSVIVSPPFTPITRFVVPHVAGALYGGSTFSAYGNLKNQWVDMSSTATPHYGLKAGIAALGGSSTIPQVYLVEVVLFVECRNQR